MRGPLIALVLGVAAYWLTREIIVGVLVAGASLWLLRGSLQQTDRRRTERRAAQPNLDPLKRNVRRGEGIAVVCKQVTLERQEWVSVKTGRLFDVLGPDGPPDAKPGDSGEVFVQGTRYLIKTSAKHTR